MNTCSWCGRPMDTYRRYCSSRCEHEAKESNKMSAGTAIAVGAATVGIGYVLWKAGIVAISILLGWSGLDRFIVRSWGVGFLKLGLFISLTLVVESQPTLLHSCLSSMLLAVWLMDVFECRRLRHVQKSDPLPAPSVWIAAIFSILGFIGLDRFYIGDNAVGQLKVALFMLMVVDGTFHYAPQHTVNGNSGSYLVYLIVAVWIVDAILVNIKLRNATRAQDIEERYFRKLWMR